MKQSTSYDTFHVREGEVIKDFSFQKDKVFKAFLDKPRTMLMVAHNIGLERANVCWLVGMLKDENAIALREKKLCEISKHRAGYYTTNKNLFPSLIQDC